VTFRLLYLIFVRLCGWLALLPRGVQGFLWKTKRPPGRPTWP